MTVPNLITTMRIILAPIFIIYLINDQILSALVVFIIAGVSDGLDGLVARVFNQKSKLGTYLDPLADKILLVAAFVGLSVRGFLPSWLTVLVISRDVMILLGVLVLSLNRMEISIKPKIASKITTCLQFVTIIAVLSKGYILKDYIPYSEKLYFYLFGTTALFTIGSGLHYIHYWFRMAVEESQER